MEIKPRVKQVIVHTEAEYLQFQEAVGGRTWDRIMVDGSPKSREALLAAVKAHDASRTPTSKTSETLFKWIAETKWEAPSKLSHSELRASEARVLRDEFNASETAFRAKHRVPEGVRVKTTKRDGVRFYKKTWKKSHSLKWFSAWVKRWG
jgi:hypothetical protein